MPPCYRSAAAFKLQRHADALADAEKAIELDPDFVKAYLRRATAHSSLEDHEAALRDYEKVVKDVGSSCKGIVSHILTKHLKTGSIVIIYVVHSLMYRHISICICAPLKAARQLNPTK